MGLQTMSAGRTRTAQDSWVAQCAEGSTCPFRPLEMLADLLARDRGILLDVDNAMDMGTVRVDGMGGQVVIHRYKHYMTRRYLNVDAAGHAYKFLGGQGLYQVQPLLDAVAHYMS